MWLPSSIPGNGLIYTNIAKTAPHKNYRCTLCLRSPEIGERDSVSPEEGETRQKGAPERTGSLEKNCPTEYNCVPKNTLFNIDSPHVHVGQPKQL